MVGLKGHKLVGAQPVIGVGEEGGEKDRESCVHQGYWAVHVERREKRNGKGKNK